jgi:methionyl-tRNA formyltransferase
MTNPQSTILLGKGDLACKIAQWFLESPSHDLVFVVPVVPEPTWAPSLIDWCVSNDVPFVASGKVDDIPGAVAEHWRVDVAFSSAYDRIIKPWFIDKCGRILNLHNSPLPRYRGMAPINWALKNGEDLHGATIHEITPGIDDGPIIAQVLYSIYPDHDEVHDVFCRSIPFGFAMFTETMPNLHTIQPREQDHKSASYYNKAQTAELGERRDFTRELSIARSARP